MWGVAFFFALAQGKRRFARGLFSFRGLERHRGTRELLSKYKENEVETNWSCPASAHHTHPAALYPAVVLRENKKQNKKLPQQEGAEGFLKVQYTAISKMAVFLLFFIVISYMLRPSGSEELQHTGVRRVGNTTLGVIAGACFLVGALCSAAAGYISM